MPGGIAWLSPRNLSKVELGLSLIIFLKIFLRWWLDGPPEPVLPHGTSALRDDLQR